MIRINLLKPETKEISEEPTALPEFKARKGLPAYSLVVVLALLAVVLLYFFQRNSFTNEQNLLSKAQEEKKSLEYVIATLAELENQKSLYEKKINLIRSLKARQEDAVKIMDELSKNIPEWVWLTDASFDSQNIQIKGRALSNNLIADYISNLELSPYIGSVSLDSSTQRRLGNNEFMEFSLNAKYLMPQESSTTDEAQKGVKQ
jgi:type IV pilus assembly protein PilN